MRPRNARCHDQCHAERFPMDGDQTFSFSRRLHRGRITSMKYAVIGMLLAVGCSSPTAPTTLPGAPVTTTPPVTPPPVIVTPPPVVVTPPILPAFPPNDARFNLTFYRQFAHDALERYGDTTPLRRQPEAPRIYLRTVDDANRPMDSLTLDQTAAALENTAGSLTGVFGLAGLERGTGTRQGQRGWITVRWAADASPERYCGYAYIAGDLIVLYPRTAGCRCSGGPAVRLRTVKHELGHALGFYHTDSPADLMYGSGSNACDQTPSAREIYHASIAYQRPIGSPAP